MKTSNHTINDNPPNSDMDYRIFNMHTDVNACDRTPGCRDTKRECALKVDSGRKVPCHTRELNLLMVDQSGTLSTKLQPCKN